MEWKATLGKERRVSERTAGVWGHFGFLLNSAWCRGDK